MSSRNVKVPQLLADFLQEVKEEKHASLALADKALGQKLKELPGFDKLDIVASSDSAAGRSVEEIFRAIRENMSALMPETASTFERVALGLSHSIDRYKLKFTEDKVDSMIIHAVKHLEDLDQALNVMAMRTKEWYGWHFPEMSRHISDNVAYARVIIETGTRDTFATADLTTVLPEPMAEAVKAAAEISMGTDIDKDDMESMFFFLSSSLVSCANSLTIPLFFFVQTLSCSLARLSPTLSTVPSSLPTSRTACVPLPPT